MANVTYVARGFAPYLIDTPLPIYETVAIEQFYRQGYFDLNYVWQISSPYYRFCKCERLKKHFIINIIYYIDFNVTLVQLSPFKKENPFPKIYWYKGELKGWRIGQTAKIIDIIIIEPIKITPLQQRYIVSIQ